jgi:hypothetical protein
MRGARPVGARSTQVAKRTTSSGVPSPRATFAEMAGTPPDGVAGAGPVVLCCAAEDAAELEEVVAALSAKGSTVELVSNAAVEPKALEPVVARFAGEGIYVLCRSEGLTREAVDALREILLAHRVPFGRTLTVTSIRADELVDRISRALRRTAGGVGTGNPTAGKLPRRTMLGVPAPAPPPPAAPLPVERDDSLPMEGADGHEDTVTDASPAQEDTIAGSAISEEPPPSKPDGPIEFDELTTLEVPQSWIDEEELAHTQSRASPAAPRRPAPPPPPRKKPAPPEDSLANAPLITAADLADLAADSGPIELTSREPKSTARSPSAALITGDTVIARLVGDRGHRTSGVDVTERVPQEVLTAAASARPAASAPLDPRVAIPPSTPDAPARGGLSGVWIAVAAVAVLGLIAGGWVLSRDGEAPAKTAEAEHPRPPEEAPPPPPEDELEPPEEPAANATLPGQLETAVMTALRNRELRALDVLLVANEESPPLSYADAETYCRTFEVAGLVSWRIPEVGELVSMTEAGMVGGAIYWSRTPADTFGDSRFAWHGRFKRVLQRDADARVLCVRGEHGDF